MRSVGRGEVLVSLCWQPAAARLTVVLLKARNLPKMDVTGLADPYVSSFSYFTFAVEFTVYQEKCKVALDDSLKKC